jgi:hypothetical protein
MSPSNVHDFNYYQPKIDEKSALDRPEQSDLSEVLGRDDSFREERGITNF